MNIYEILLVEDGVYVGEIKKGKKGWEKNLPPSVARMIKQKKLFGYKPH